MLYTIGHGSRPLGEFIALLAAADIVCVVDVRAYPVSRRYPQFTREALERALAREGVSYVWEGRALGGRRRPAASSRPVALKPAGFQAYADYMATGAFQECLERLVEIGRAAPAAMLCAERVPAQCHRFLISDALVARGVPVVHLIDGGLREDHRLSPLARLRGGVLHYDGAAQGDLGL